MHLRSCVGFFKGLWIEGREKRTISGVREQRHRTSLRGVSCKTLSGGKKDPNQVSEPEGPCHQPGYNIGFCVCPAAALYLNTDSALPSQHLCMSLCRPHCLPALMPPAPGASWPYSLPPEGCVQVACLAQTHLSGWEWVAVGGLGYKAGLQCLRDRVMRGRKGSVASCKWALQWVAQGTGSVACCVTLDKSLVSRAQPPRL